MFRHQFTGKPLKFFKVGVVSYLLTTKHHRFNILLLQHFISNFYQIANTRIRINIRTFV
ncbi:hypothetical protein HanIR_Chr12g0583141 [Helianthus annuus]|nr:hypothetical protein HanIR_Chr12g0583141 [Helianthus annuus]